MPWSKSRPRGTKANAKYETKEYRETAKQLRADLKAAGSGICAELVCIKRSRLITPDMELHVCHDRRTGQIRGLGHASCNLSEAGRYARALQSRIRMRL